MSDFNAKKHLRGRFVDQKLVLSYNFRCDQIHDVTHFVVLLRSDLDVQQTHLRGWFVEKRLILSSYFRCDKSYNYERYDLAHTLLCHLSLT